MSTRKRLGFIGLGLGLVLLVVAAVQALSLRDIRPPGVQGELSAGSVREARRLLTALVARYGGSAAWRRQAVTQVEYTDEWASPIMRRLGSPWREGERMRLTFTNGSENARLDFLAGPRQGTSWGIQQWMTYELRSGQRQFVASKDIKFWLPTLQYFLELPFRIGEADLVAHAGERTVSGRTYDLVYVTWGRPEPQPSVDQYVLWIRRGDSVLEYVEYTVRDLLPSLTGCIHYEDLREVQGVLLPFRMTLADCPGRPGMLHRQTVSAARFLPELPRAELVPEPERRAGKSDK